VCRACSAWLTGLGLAMGCSVACHVMPLMACHVPAAAQPRAGRTLPYRALPCHATPCHAMQSSLRSMPWPTMPGTHCQCHAMPCHAPEACAMPCHAPPKFQASSPRTHAPMRHTCICTSCAPAPPPFASVNTSTAPCADAGSYRNKAHATGRAADANTGYSSGLGNVGAQGAGAR